MIEPVETAPKHESAFAKGLSCFNLLQRSVVDS